MRLSVCELASDDEHLESFSNAKAGKQHLRIQAGCVGDRHHRNIGAIRPRKECHQAGQWLNSPGHEPAKGLLLFCDDRALTLWWLVGQKSLTDRRIGKALQLFRE